MTPILVKFERDWGDEFNVYGFKVFDSIDKWNEYYEEIKDEQWWFGTNEGFEPGELEETDFTVHDVTDGEIAILKKFFPEMKWGHFPK